MARATAEKRATETLQELIRNEPTTTLFGKLMVFSGVDAALARGTYTVFAPVDNAFEEVPLATLFADAQLARRFVALHVVEGRYVGSYFNDRTVVTTLLGTGVEMDRSKFITPDIECRNGILHIIDRVLIAGDPDAGITR